jgi:flagellar biosynthetic protein FlhB
VGRFDGKTEKATPQRRQKARREGQIARSQEVGVALSLVAGVLVLRVFTPAALGFLERETAAILANASDERLPLGALGGTAARMALALGGPFLAAAVLAAVVAGVAQTGFSIAPKQALPKLSRLDPRQGLRRLAPVQAGWELVRSLLKLGLLTALLWGPVSDWGRRIGSIRDLDAGLASLLTQTWTVLLRGLLLVALIGALDYGYQRWRTTRELRMSKEEVKREAKDQDGDPLIKAQRRRRGMELSRNRMMREIASADVVVTNPTHLAVALRYADGDPAPRVIAKGADRLAARIRAEARRHGILVTENKPLARALYRRCKVGHYVPAALYEAVAVVLALAYRRYGRVAA